MKNKIISIFGKKYRRNPDYCSIGDPYGCDKFIPVDASNQKKNKIKNLIKNKKII